MSDAIMAGSIPCHGLKDLDSEFTDKKLVSHLIHSDCTECRSAGFRLKDLVENNKSEQKVKYSVEVVKPIDYSPDWVEFVTEFDTVEEAVEFVNTNPVFITICQGEGLKARISVTGINNGYESHYMRRWHSPVTKFRPKSSGV